MVSGDSYMINETNDELWLKIVEAVRTGNREQAITLAEQMPEWGGHVRDRDIMALVNHSNPHAQEFAAMVFWKILPGQARKSFLNNNDTLIRSGAEIGFIMFLLEGQKATS